MPWSSFILSCHFEEFDYSQNILLVLSLRLIQFIVTFPFMVRGGVHPKDHNIVRSSVFKDLNSEL
jgi:hypothetical protein